MYLTYSQLELSSLCHQLCRQLQCGQKWKPLVVDHSTHISMFPLSLSKPFTLPRFYLPHRDSVRNFVKEGQKLSIENLWERQSKLVCLHSNLSCKVGGRPLLLPKMKPCSPPPFPSLTSPFLTSSEVNTRSCILMPACPRALLSSRSTWFLCSVER